MPGKTPPRKATTQAGVLGISFCRFRVVFFMYESRILVSDLLRMRDPRPDSRTGVAYKLFILRDAAGLHR